MTSQLPSSNLPDFLDLGNMIAYIGAKKTSFASAESATDWRKLGMLKSGLQLANSKTSLDIKSGVPQRLIRRFFTEETLKTSGEMMEITPFNLARDLGGLTITTTVKSSSPTPTTVAASSTKSSIICAAVTGFKVGDLICVGTPGTGSEQFCVIQSIDTGTKTITPVEPLSLDTDPVTAAAVSKVDKQTVPFGSVGSPQSVSLKFSKTLVGGVGTLDIYILNAQADGNSTLSWDDNGTVNPVGIPFSFEALSDPNVESGNTAEFVFTQA